MKKNIQIYIAVPIIAISLIYLVYSSQNNLETANLNKVLNERNFYDDKLKNMPSNDPHVKKIFSNCGIEKHCTIESLQKLSESESKITVIETAREILSTYEEIGFYCHENGHHIGMLLYGFIGNLSEAILSVEPRCGGSVHHGIIQNYFATSMLLKNQKIDEFEITHICDVVLKSSLSRTECLHGIGHGLIDSYNYDLISALNRCDEFEEAPSCYSGTAMGFGKNYYETYKESLNEDEILQVCKDLEEKYQSACYQFQANNLLIFKNLSTKDSLAVCDTLENTNEIKYCYTGVGIQIFTIYHNNFELYASECLQGNPNFQTYCLFGGEGVIIDQLGMDKGFEFCKALPEKFKSKCYAQIGDWLRKHHSPNEVKENCLKVGDMKYFEICTTKLFDRVKCNVEFVDGDSNKTIDMTDSSDCGFE